MHRITQRHAKLPDGSTSQSIKDADARKYAHAARVDRPPAWRMFVIPLTAALIVLAVAMYNITYIKARTQTLTKEIHLGSLFTPKQPSSLNGSITNPKAQQHNMAVGLVQWFTMHSDKKLMVPATAGTELLKEHRASPRLASATDGSQDSSQPPKTLPVDFNWKMYLSNYEDLRTAGLSTQHEAEEHYMHTGYAEHRIYNELLGQQLLDFNTTGPATAATAAHPATTASTTTPAATTAQAQQAAASAGVTAAVVPQVAAQAAVVPATTVATPVVTPAVTPAVTPVVTPTVTPVVTPTVTPVVTPTVTPVVTPVVTHTVPATTTATAAVVPATTTTAVVVPATVPATTTTAATTGAAVNPAAGTVAALQVAAAGAASGTGAAAAHTAHTAAAAHAAGAAHGASDVFPAGTTTTAEGVPLVAANAVGTTPLQQ